MTKADEIKQACETAWDANKSDCSGFVRAVATKLGLALDGNADAIVDRIRHPASGWSNGGPLFAQRQAELGQLVIGGLRGADQVHPDAHGHVVVVVAGPLDPQHGKYPHAYWGRLGSVGMKDATINLAWREVDRDNVVYGAIAPA